jgi:putative nucleotidyltransferase with HDIG domain
MAAIEVDPREETLLQQAARERVRPLAWRERLVEGAAAAGVVAAIAALALLAPGSRPTDPLTALLLLAVYATARHVRFRVGAGTLEPTEPVLVGMLLLLPPSLAVAFVVLGSLIARVPDYLARRTHPDRALLVIGDGWHAVGGALAIALLAPGAASLEHWPAYLAALAAQITFDTGTGALRAWASLGVPPRFQVRLLGIVYAFDLSLAPVGLLAALAAHDAPAAVLLVLPLIGLLAVLGREREGRIENALALSDAYRGTALLMGDMLEADDPYTGGEHSKGVVALACEVGRELRLDAREQRHLEFGALLHDIGKLHTPDEILNKPGKLTPEEWGIIKRHPEDGQAMLDRIGGVLAEVGLIVRGHHERWDGRGYPDGLVAEQTPLAARIICVCDAFSAMTTNRPYRGAMPVDEALDELDTCAGTQFDPEVVKAVRAVVERALPPRVSELLAA